MIENNSLKNHFLVAMPNLDDPLFFQAVVFLCEYNDQGAMGIIINKPMEINLGTILRHLEIPITDNKVDNFPVLKGGPVAKQQGFILFRDTISDSKEKDLEGEIIVSALKEDLIQLAQGQHVNDSLFSLGYAAWGAGQLEQELADNAWLLAPAHSSILFDIPFEQRWRHAAALIGVDLDRMSGEVGHA